MSRLLRVASVVSVARTSLFLALCVALLPLLAQCQTSAEVATEVASILQGGVLDPSGLTVSMSVPGLGSLRGLADVSAGYFSFLGVPFASPPTGSLRWRAPVDVTSSSWPAPLDEPYNATARQQDCVRTTFPPDGTLRGSEDCLYLNIFVPATNVSKPAAGFPVVFYIHGGGLQTTDFDFDAVQPVANSQALVYVHVYYRVGVFGFLTHPALSAESSPHLSSGNYGLMDQQSALRWVHNHIRAFGGDPARVTLQGHSAGALSVCFHLVMPQSADLFSQAILHSGSCETVNSVATLTLVEGEAFGVGVAESMSCPLPPFNATSSVPSYVSQLECLRELDAFQAFAAVVNVSFTTVVDSVLIPNFPSLLFRSGQFAVVPTLLGTTPAELADLYYLHGLALPPPSAVSWGLVSAVAASFTGARTALAPRFSSFYTESVYAVEFNSTQPVQAMLDCLNDYVIKCPVRRLASYSAHTQLYNDSADVHVWSWMWQYLPVHLPAALIAAGLKQAAHGHEMPFVFAQPNVLSNYTFTPQEYGLSAIVQNLIARFVLAGNPNAANPSIDARFADAYTAALKGVPNVKPYALPLWPAYVVDYTASDEQLLVFQPDASIATTTTRQSATTLLTATTSVAVAVNSTGFSIRLAGDFFGLTCDAIADAPLPLDNTAQLRLSVCSIVQGAADVCLSVEDPLNVCVDLFNNTYACSCNAAGGFKPSHGALSCIPPHNGFIGASGDPQLVGLLGQSYQVHGLDGGVYNFITHPSLQVNARFAFLGGSVDEYTCPAHTECWSHPGSYINSLGVAQRLGDRTVHVEVHSGRAASGFSSVVADGRPMEIGQTVRFTSADGAETFELTANSSNLLTLNTPLFTFQLANSDRFLNYRLHPRVPLASLSTHGLLGQTWRKVERSRRGTPALPIEGHVDDYLVQSGQLFGSDHLFDLFAASLLNTEQ